MDIKRNVVKSWNKLTNQAPEMMDDVLHREEKFGMTEFYIGLAVGSTLGFLASLLFAPQSGRETREYLSDKSHELTRKAKDTVEDVKDKTERLVDKGQKEFDATKRQTRDFSYETREQLSDTLDRAANEVDPKPRI